MALNSRQKRAAVIGVGRPWYRNPHPSGMGAAQRASVGSAYPVALFAIPTVTPDLTFGLFSLISQAGIGLTSIISSEGQGINGQISSSVGVLAVISNDGIGIKDKL